MSETLLNDAAATPTAATERHSAPPVTDWVHDFDHTDPRWTENPFPIWDELRARMSGGSHQAFPWLLPAHHL